MAVSRWRPLEISRVSSISIVHRRAAGVALDRRVLVAPRVVRRDVHGRLQTGRGAVAPDEAAAAAAMRAAVVRRAAAAAASRDQHRLTIQSDERHAAAAAAAPLARAATRAAMPATNTGFAPHGAAAAAPH